MPGSFLRFFLHVGCGQATISRRFGSIYQLAQPQSKNSLRGRLFLLASSGCSPIALPKRTQFVQKSPFGARFGYVSASSGLQPYPDRNGPPALRRREKTWMARCPPVLDTTRLQRNSVQALGAQVRIAMLFLPAYLRELCTLPGSAVYECLRGVRDIHRSGSRTRSSRALFA